MTALETAALALVTRFMRSPRRARCHGERVEPQPSNTEASSHAAPLRDQDDKVEQFDFLTQDAGDDARFYRALDAFGEVYTVFYADGRVRLADRQHRMAGIVQSGHADLLEIANNTWSELFVRVTPEGRMQLEMRGGPYDARILTCEPFNRTGA